MKNTSIAIIALSLLGALPARSVSLVSSGDDLDVVFEDQLIFQVAGYDGSFSFGIALKEVYSIPQPFGFALATSSSTLQLPLSSSDQGFGGSQNPAVEEAGPNDLALLWQFTDEQWLSTGDTVSIAPGTFTLPDYLLSGGFPDTAASTVDVWLINSRGKTLALPLAVPLNISPIPDGGTTLLLMGLGLVGIGAVRRRV